MENKRQVKLYVSNVCFRNMGKGDLLFQTRGKRAAASFGAYQLCCAYAESSSTYRSIVENYADQLRTGIVEMSDLEAGEDVMLAGMVHVSGVYTNGQTFFFTESAPGTLQQPYRKPQEPPCWHVAYVKMQDGPARRYYAMVNRPELMRSMLLNMAARYGLPFRDIVSVRPMSAAEGPWGWLWALLPRHKPGHMATRRQMNRLLLHGKQDMGIYFT